jgi:formate/nitrite transporter FocA (FNT family)
MASKLKAEDKKGRPKGIDEKEIKDVREMSSPRTPVIYEIVRRLGLEEMARPATSLWWSGIAGGLSISFSLLAQAILQTHLPDAPWRPLVVSFGYCIGFVMVVMARQQLFTESTITAVIPVTANFTWKNVGRMGRLWAIVLAANLVGTFFAALFCNFTPAVPPEILEGMRAVSRPVFELGWFDMMFRAISAGFLMAAMVWLIPGAENNQFYIIVLMTYLIAIGEFAHVVAGSVEGFLLLVHGELGIGMLVGGFFIPVLIGNIIGGTALFALISYAQVMEEI